MCMSALTRWWSRPRSWFSPGPLPRPREITLVTVEFVPHGDESELVLTHERFPKADEAQRYESGWGTIADKFAAYLSCRGPKVERT